MTGSTFWPWWLGGLAVASVGIASALLLGRPLGVSGLYERLVASPPRGGHVPIPSATVASEDELAAALMAATEDEFGTQPDDSLGTELSSEEKQAVATSMARDHTTPMFLVGIAFGGALTTILSGERPSLTSLGASFDARFAHGGTGLAVAALGVAGVFIGFGTRMAGGCTSGHGITGVALGCRGSLLSTAVFWGTGVAVARLLSWVAR